MYLAAAVIMAALQTATVSTVGPQTQGMAYMDTLADTHWKFGGELGRRIDANLENWILRAPDANPGLLEMFRRRDRQWPYADIVPWAGEFAGKYLIAAVQARRMTEDPRLDTLLKTYVEALIAGQAEDGYLGPFRKDARLLGQWDLWGHYHVMLGLLMWHDATGDPKAWEAVRRAADLICAIYGDGGRRPIEAGAPECNLSVMHAMAMLYHRTGDTRYRALLGRIEEDLHQAGDWLRQGERGTPYHRLPMNGTRWESLHIVQGLAELHRNTGDERYRAAVVNLWESIQRYDRHPSGAFSTHERAFGSPYAEGSIETCCSVAWMALTIDMLRLTGRSTAADELELTLWNEAMAAQHPSGSWWTYDTPLNGVRIPSFHHINFQYRPGAPELNCCSVNAPRLLGMLPDWAALWEKNTLVINFYGPCEAVIPLPGGDRLTLTQKTGYPVDGQIELRLSTRKRSAFAVKLRIPAWSRNTSVRLNGTWNGPMPEPGAYLVIPERTWGRDERIDLKLDMSPHHWTGEGPREGRAALYTGPLLLAFDTQWNATEVVDLAPVDLARRDLRFTPPSRDKRPGFFPPMGYWTVPVARNLTEPGATEDFVVLCDFASAGAHGTEYVSWLPAVHAEPAPIWLELPRDGAEAAPGAVLFRWHVFGAANQTFELIAATDPEFRKVVYQRPDIQADHVTVRDYFDVENTYYWTVRRMSGAPLDISKAQTQAFTITTSAQEPFMVLGEGDVMVESSLDGDGAPRFGICIEQTGLQPAADRRGNPAGAVRFDGASQKLRYRLPFYPARDYTFRAWVYPEDVAAPGVRQVMSGWCGPMDDPLRLTIENGAMSARIESGRCYGTPGVAVHNGEWIHVAAVKSGSSLTLYIDGKAVAKTEVPEFISTASNEIGIGYNPLFGEGERLTGRIDDFAFYARACTEQEIQAASAAEPNL